MTRPAQATAPEGPRTYGNWRRPTSPGIGSLGLLGTAVLMGGLLGVVVAMMLFGFLLAGVVAVVTGGCLGLLSHRDRHHRNAGQRIITRLGWARARSTGANLYRSGPLGRTPWGRYQLPGLLARSELSEWGDSYGRPFALVRVPQTNHYTVVLETQPDGAALVDEDQVDRWVAGWGMWLSRLSREPDVVAASVTIDTAPDTGARLRLEVERNLSTEGHPAAHAMLRETVSTYPGGSAQVRAFIAVTVKGTTPAGKRRPAGDVARDLGARLPGMVSTLAGTGAGAVHLVSAYELCQVVRTAYDPAVATMFDEAHAHGQRVQLDWSDVGPVAADTSWAGFRHDSCRSVSWTMTQPPRGTSLAGCLTQLVGTHPDVDRKRVTLLYRPIPAGTAAGIVEADKRNAEFAVTGQTRVSARASTDLAAAAATATEEARGAGLVNFGLVVTATVTDPDRLDDAKAAVDTLSASARILLRPAYGCQDSAFAASLPLGLVLPTHLKVPAALRAAV
jgi:hypothetical protein